MNKPIIRTRILRSSEMLLVNQNCESKLKSI